jgi:hypothetical protein
VVRGANAVTEVAVNEHKAEARKNFILSFIYQGVALPVELIFKGVEARDVISEKTTALLCQSSIIASKISRL